MCAITYILLPPAVDTKQWRADAGSGLSTTNNRSPTREVGHQNKTMGCRRGKWAVDKEQWAADAGSSPSSENNLVPTREAVIVCSIQAFFQIKYGF